MNIELSRDLAGAIINQYNSIAPYPKRIDFTTADILVSAADILFLFGKSFDFAAGAAIVVLPHNETESKWPESFHVSFIDNEVTPIEDDPVTAEVKRRHEARTKSK